MARILVWSERPELARELLGEARRLADLGAHRLKIGIIGGLVVIEHAEPVAAQMDQPFRVVGQPDDQRLFGKQKFRRQCHAPDERHVRCLDAAVGKIKAWRRFRGARHADQADIGIVDPPA